MNLEKVSKTSDPLGRYYTDASIATLLVDSMKDIVPSLVIDLGAGNGALIGEAAKVWTTSRFVTVDIDQKAGCTRLPHLKGASFQHHVGDALDVRLAEKLGIEYGEADSALCNPPYIRTNWKKHFGDILEDAGLSHVIPKMAEMPADLLFLAQNIRFLRNGGRLGLILPDGIIAGEKFTKFRAALTSKHCVERVIELPRRIFKNTDAKAHIVVLSKFTSTSGSISIQRVEENGFLSPKLELKTEQAAHRLDYSYHIDIKNVNIKRDLLLRNVVNSLSRGTYSSSVLRQLNTPVFHTTDFDMNSDSVPRKFILSNQNATEVSGVFAEPGDILIARVGRNLEQKVCQVSRGKVLVSDCVLVLRVMPEFRERVFSFLKSNQGQDALRTASHGVAASFITTNALLDLKI